MKINISISTNSEPGEQGVAYQHLSTSTSVNKETDINALFLGIMLALQKDQAVAAVKAFDVSLQEAIKLVEKDKEKK